MSDLKAVAGLLTSSYLNLLLVAVPLGFASHFLGWPAWLRFTLVGAHLGES